MIFACVLAGVLAGAVAAAVALLTGADPLTCLALFAAVAYPVTVALMLAGDSRDRARRADEEREIEADLIALRESQLRAEQARSRMAEGVSPVLFRALRLQEQTSLRTRGRGPLRV